MSVDWVAVSAVASAASALVVAGTVVAAYAQIRHAREQVRQLRRATQLEGTMAVFDELASPKSVAEINFVLNDLAVRMQDPAYRNEILKKPTLDDVTHMEIGLMRRYEKIGTYVKNGLLEGDVLYDYGGLLMLRLWEKLNETQVVPLLREHRSPTLWENFEFLYKEVKAYSRRKNLDFSDEPGSNQSPQAAKET